MKKIAIIVSGGGMTCSFSVGVIHALVKEFKLTDPDIVIACSGSAGTMSYYVSKQYSSIINIWSNLLSNSKFINLLRFWKIIDINYLIDVVFKKLDPLHVKKIYSSNINYLIPVTNYLNGTVEYLLNKNHCDIFEAMRATKAMPLAFGRSVNINGVEYCDSILSSQGDTHIQKAIALGATHIIIIESINIPSPFIIFWFKLWLLFRPRIFKHNYHLLQKKIENMTIPNGVKLLRICPKEKINMNNFNNKSASIKSAINLGYNQCNNSIELKEFLNDFYSP